MYIKILNLGIGKGTVDYKGIDINEITPGSQIYNEVSDSCILEVNTVNLNSDIVEISLEEYEIIKNEWLQNNNSPFNLEEKIAKLEEENEVLKADNLTTLEALAEVYEMLLAMQS